MTVTEELELARSCDVQARAREKEGERERKGKNEGGIGVRNYFCWDLYGVVHDNPNLLEEKC